MSNQTQTTEAPNRRSVLSESGLAFSLAEVILLILSTVALLVTGAILGENAAESDVYKYVGYLAPQLGIAAACLIFFRREKMPFKEAYAPCKWYYFPIALLVAFGLFSLSEVNGYWIDFLIGCGYRPSDATLPNVTGWGLLPAILVIALLPAVFEETLFRRIQLHGMQRGGWGTAPVIFISGALFSLFHGSPEQTLYQFACGCVYALLAIRSGSVLPTVLAHFANNAVILALTSAGYEDIPSSAKLPFYLVAGMVLASVLIFLIFFQKNGNRRGGVKGGGKYFAAAFAGIVLCAVQWIFVLVQGFLK